MRGSALTLIEYPRCWNRNRNLGHVSISEDRDIHPLTLHSNMADEFPSAKVIATDITPTQPSFVPPNLEFQIDDAQMEWTFEPESFDFIHIRYLQGSIEDWNKLYGQVYKALKPGGWFQHIEPDLQMLSQNPDVVVDDKQYVPYLLPNCSSCTDPKSVASLADGLKSSTKLAKRWAEHSTLPIASRRRWPSLQASPASLTRLTRSPSAGGPRIRRRRSWEALSVSPSARHSTAS